MGCRWWNVLPSSPIRGKGFLTIGDSGRTGCCITLIVILVMLGFSITGTHIAPKQERCKMIIALGKSILKPPNTVGYGWKGAQHFWVAKKSINVVRSLTSTSIDVPIKYTAIAWPFLDLPLSFRTIPPEISIHRDQHRHFHCHSYSYLQVRVLL